MTPAGSFPHMITSSFLTIRVTYKQLIRNLKKADEQYGLKDQLPMALCLRTNGRTNLGEEDHIRSIGLSLPHRNGISDDWLSVCDSPIIDRLHWQTGWVMSLALCGIDVLLFVIISEYVLNVIVFIEALIRLLAWKNGFMGTNLHT